MASKANKMPTFDAMDMLTSIKSVLGFNLSFFADESDIVSDLFDQICAWLKYEKLKVPRVTELEM